MKNYVIASHDHASHKLYYLSEISDKYTFSTVDKAMRFDKNEALDLLRDDDNLSYLGFVVVHVADPTFEAFKKDRDLVWKFSQLDYAVP